MTSRPPPRLATWLLQRCLRGRHVESLIGDLLELHQQGKTNGWYWRQVLTAISVNCVEALRASGRAVVLALIMGWAAILLWRELNSVFIAYSDDIYRALRRASVTGDERLLIIWSLGALLRFVSFVAIGWLVARVNARHPALTVALFVVSVMLLPVPWEQVRVLEHGLHRLAYYAIALVGIFAGAWLTRRRQPYSMINGS